jgi:hypothetical protein
MKINNDELMKALDQAEAGYELADSEYQQAAVRRADAVIRLMKAKEAIQAQLRRMDKWCGMCGIDCTSDHK